MPEALILIVDDSPSIRETLSFLLRRKGYEVETAVNGKEGLEAIRRLKPQAVLLDAMMPEMDGFELSRSVRSDPDLSSTPIIMLTAMGQSIDRDRAHESGVDFFLTKPPDIQRTLEVLHEACSA